jgi:hypothetical protein
LAIEVEALPISREEEADGAIWSGFLVRSTVTVRSRKDTLGLQADGVCELLGSRRVPMEEFGARLCERRVCRVTDTALLDTPADYVSRFEHEHTAAIAREMVRGGQARKAAADDNY